MAVLQQSIISPRVAAKADFHPTEEKPSCSPFMPVLSENEEYTQAVVRHEAKVEEMINKLNSFTK
jgi:hypothetical protein